MSELRIREAGEVIGRLEPGPWNALTDVRGVRVGHTTLCEPEQGVHSGVTAIVPEGKVLPAGLSVANGYGKFVGATQVMELGEVETPILLTSTLSAFRTADALLTWVLDRAERPVRTINPVVGEINDSWLSHTVLRPVTADHVWNALDTATSGPVAMGNVGGGTGACALGYKAGIGTSSRRVAVGGQEASVGVLVQANMDGDLRVRGNMLTPRSLGLPVAGSSSAEGSCVVVIAVDFACSARQLSRIANRGVFALGRTGAAYSHGSGDYALAFSTRPAPPRAELRPAELDLVFTAVMDSVEEAVLDSLLAATTVITPGGRRAAALPHSALLKALA
ncbi:D-aminopeptidase [Streptosporangium becharense]|uniref:D-aminopeptidase n=1 Tax=Streptosporangium becharense TaxID=1816182 RepID=A0A7W9MKB4_9ACTN|nr:P1 family peptidase [Streptosporangium becharense]MBB2910576.1 D-aminopeptidase [Streptosporangium becharense]MBB5823319.1 D-aminopeptidase [Streptosporangium becharense]